MKTPLVVALLLSLIACNNAADVTVVETDNTANKDTVVKNADMNGQDTFGQSKAGGVKPAEH